MFTRADARSLGRSHMEAQLVSTHPSHPSPVQVLSFWCGYRNRNEWEGVTTTIIISFFPPSFPRSPLLCKATECSDLITSLLMLCQESDIPWSLLRNPMNSWVRPSSLFPLVSPSFLFIMLFLHHCILFTTLKNACVSVYHSSQFRFSVAWKAEAERENRYVCILYHKL